MTQQLKFEQEKEIIFRITESSVFHGSETLSKLLRYLAGKSHDDPTGHLKEYQIATETLGRGVDFDPRTDSYVRTQVTRLRSKLLEYSLTEGANDPLVVEIPRGSYKLLYSPRSGEDGDTHPAAMPRATQAVNKTLEEWKGSERFWRLLCAALVVVLAATLGLAVWALRTKSSPSRQPALDPVLAAFWSPFITPDAEPLAVFSNAVFVGRPDSGMHYFHPKNDAAGEMTDHYTGVGEVLGIHELDNVFSHARVALRVKRGALLSLDDAKSMNLIFVGAPVENLSVNDVVTLKYFRFQSITTGPRKGENSIRNLNPEKGEPEVFLNSPIRPIVDDYALIARLPGLGKRHVIVLAAGTTTIGTQAAVEYLCHAETLRPLLEQMGGIHSDQSFEAVLSIKIARGVPVKTSLAALRHYGN